MHGEVAHHQVMLLDALLIRDDFHIADFAPEILVIKYVVLLGWMAPRTVCV